MQARKVRGDAVQVGQARCGLEKQQSARRQHGARDEWPRR